MVKRWPGLDAMIIAAVISFSGVPGALGLPAALPAGLQPLRGGAFSLRQVSFRHLPASQGEPGEEQGKSEHTPLFDSQMMALSITLVKTLLGSSILTLTGGLAGATDLKWAWMPASFVTLAFALTSAYTYTLVGTCCNEIGATTYTDLWAKTISASSAWVPTTGCVAFTAIGCQVYTIVMRDILAHLIHAYVITLPHSTQATRIHSMTTNTGLSGAILRREAQLGLLGSVLLPLCWLRSLTALAAVSWVGMAGVLYLMCFLIWRCITAAYHPGGAFAPTPSGPIFGSRFDAKNVLVFFSLLHGCYQTHYDAPRFFAAVALQPRAVERFNVLAYVSFSIAGLVCVVVLSAGYLTFGSTAKTVILSNYAAHDMLASLGRCAVLVSLITSYPLVFNGFVSNVLGLADLFARKTAPLPFDEFKIHRRQRLKDVMAAMLVAANVSIALFVEDLGFICAFTGSVISGIIIFVFPAIFHMRVLSMRAAARGEEAAKTKNKKQKNTNDMCADAKNVWLAREYVLWWSSLGICAVGVVLCGLGAAVNLEIM